MNRNDSADPLRFNDQNYPGRGPHRNRSRDQVDDPDFYQGPTSNYHSRGRAKALSTRDRPAAERALRTIRNLGRAGLTPAEIGWLFDLPADLVGPVLD